MHHACTICRHPQRQDIDQLLLTGYPLRTLAAHFHLSKSALSRHHRHLRDRLQRLQSAQEEQVHHMPLAKLVPILHTTLCRGYDAATAEELVAVLDKAYQIADILKDLVPVPSTPETSSAPECFPSPADAEPALPPSSDPPDCATGQSGPAQGHPDNGTKAGQSGTDPGQSGTKAGQNRKIFRSQKKRKKRRQ